MKSEVYIEAVSWAPHTHTLSLSNSLLFSLKKPLSLSQTASYSLSIGASFSLNWSLLLSLIESVARLAVVVERIGHHCNSS